MTVKELKEFLKDIPDNTEIVISRARREKPIFKYIKTKNLTSTTEEVQIS